MKSNKLNEFKIGDKIKIKGNASIDYGLTSDSIGIIKEIESDFLCVKFERNRNPTWWIKINDSEKIKEQKVVNDDMVIVPFWVVPLRAIFRWDRFWWIKSERLWGSSIGGNRTRQFKVEYVAIHKDDLPSYLYDKIIN